MPVRLMMHVRVERDDAGPGDNFVEDFSRGVLGVDRAALAEKFAAYVRDVASMFGKRDDVVALVAGEAKPARKIGFHETGEAK